MTTHGAPRDRRPAWVYREGEEPDYRFTFANERTFLAWIRTALALLAAGVAVDAVDLPMSDMLQQLLPAVIVALALVCSLLAWSRWARAERAMRKQAPLPGSVVSAVMAMTLVLVAVIVLVVVSV